MVNNDCIIVMKNCIKRNENVNERLGLEIWFNKCRCNIIYLS